MNNHDILERFVFNNTNIRGELVQLQATYQEITQQHDYPPPLQAYLGEALVISALLMASIKMQGNITLQIRAEGNVSLLVVQANHQLQLRALARYKGNLGGDFQTDFGQGQLAVTIEPENGKQYQGIVALDAQIPNLTAAIELYFIQSQQLATKIWLATDSRSAAGLFIQHLPHKAQTEEDFWQHLTLLSQTIKVEELLSLPSATILHRLYHAEEMEVFEPAGVSFKCKCSTTSMGQAVMVLGKEDIHTLLAEQGKIEITCQFCNKQYSFSEAHIEELLSLQTLAAKAGLQ